MARRPGVSRFVGTSHIVLTGLNYWHLFSCYPNSSTMHEIITVTKRGQANSYYEVATNSPKDGSRGSLGAFTRELEALQFASRHCAQSRGAAAGPALELTEEQQQMLAQAPPEKMKS